MNLQIFTNDHPFLQLLLLLLSTHFIHTKSPEKSRNEQVKPVHESVGTSTSENQFSLEPTTTTESTTTVETYRKLSLSIAGENNVSSEFKPSVHLGEIKESRISTSPFNNLQRIKFENAADGDSYQEHVNDFRLVYQPTGQSYQPDQQENYHQNAYETVAGSLEETKKDILEQNNYVKFHDDVSDDPRYQQYDGSSNDPTFHQQFAHGATENDLVDQQVFQNLAKPVYDQETAVYLGGPSRFPYEAQKHQAGDFWSGDSAKTPHYVGYYNQQGYPMNFHESDFSKKPSNGVVYIQESSILRTRKFPYPIYQPTAGYHQVEFVNEGHPNYSVRKSISPWKKILHLVGAFLPLGLLIAALTPKVVKVNNATEPSITLSKWRANDLPVEHKLARLKETKNACEERSICDMILADDDAGSAALQNILWNLATRTSVAVAKESGLQEIFEAVKKKDCSSIIC